MSREGGKELSQKGETGDACDEGGKIVGREDIGGENLDRDERNVDSAGDEWGEAGVSANQREEMDVDLGKKGKKLEGLKEWRDSMNDKEPARTECLLERVITCVDEKGIVTEMEAISAEVHNKEEEFVQTVEKVAICATPTSESVSGGEGASTTKENDTMQIKMVVRKEYAKGGKTGKEGIQDVKIEETSENVGVEGMETVRGHMNNGLEPKATAGDSSTGGEREQSSEDKFVEIEGLKETIASTEKVPHQGKGVASRKRKDATVKPVGERKKAEFSKDRLAEGGGKRNVMHEETNLRIEVEANDYRSNRGEEQLAGKEECSSRKDFEKRRTENALIKEPKEITENMRPLKDTECQEEAQKSNISTRFDTRRMAEDKHSGDHVNRAKQERQRHRVDEVVNDSGGSKGRKGQNQKKRKRNEVQKEQVHGVKIQESDGTKVHHPRKRQSSKRSGGASKDTADIFSSFDESNPEKDEKDLESKAKVSEVISAMNNDRGLSSAVVENGKGDIGGPARKGVASETFLSQGESLEATPVDLLKFAENAERFLRRDEAASRQCREVIRQSYCDQSKVEFGQDASKLQLVPQKRKEGLPPLGPVLSIDVGRYFDCDQLWEEIELRNAPLLAHIQEKLTSFIVSRKEQDTNHSTEQKEVGRKVHGKCRREDEEPSFRNPTQDLAAAIKSSRSNDGSGTSDVEDLAEAKEDEKEFSSHGIGSLLDNEPEFEERKTSKVRFAPGTKGDNVRETQADGADSIEDGFFSLEDMERFADDAEQLANNGKLVASDDEDDGIDNDYSEDEENNDHGDRQNGIFGSTARTGLNGNERLRYDDFFDPPNEEVAGSKADRISNVLGTSADDEDSDSLDETPLQLSRSRTRKLIEAIEEENVAKKPWHMRGEVSAFSRPRDSLLNTEIDLDATTDSKAVMDSDRNETIEDVIRQRIVDGLFDDVVGPLPEDYTKEKKTTDDLPEISQEKPKEGLAEIYEREFLGERERAKDKLMTREASRVQAKKTDVEETNEQKVVNQLFEKLASKLDALSGLHFTPGPAKISQEMTVHGDIKALRSEEAIPEAVSDENLLTPKEVYTVDKKKLAGDIEKTKEERRASHRRVKRGLRVQNKAKVRAARVMEQANPILAEKRRAEEAFRRRGKNIRLGEPDSKSANVSAMQWLKSTPVQKK